jgi:acyl carrier protein
LLGIEGVGTQDNFFDLRGDSLLAAQVMARLQTALRVKLPLSALFDAPTVAGLADRVRSARGGSSRVTLAPTTARTADEEEGEI